jgi:hypothetical protein
VRLAGSALALGLALCGPVAAELHEGKGYPWKPAAAKAEPPGGRATSVVVRIVGGFRPMERWLWYEGDGTARFQGELDTQRGYFRTRVDFAKVARIADDAGLCTRHATVMRPLGMDMFTYIISVRCDREWRTLTTTDMSEPEGDAQSSRAVRSLRRLAQSLAWEPVDENVAPPDRGGLFHTADRNASKTGMNRSNAVR